MVKLGMNNSEPKLHHYYPQFELEYFTDVGKLWIYDRLKNSYRQQGTKTTGAITDFYTFSDDKGKKYKELEASLSTCESIAAPVIKKIHKGEYKLTGIERSEFSAYLALKWLRTPIHQRKSEALYETLMKVESIKIASNSEKFNRVLDEVEKKEKTTIPDREKLREFMKDESKYTIQSERLVGLQTLVMSLRETGEEIFNMGWVFYFACKGRSFITSDNPFFIWPFFESDNPLGYGLRSTPAMTIIPLTPRVCLGLFYRNGHPPYKRKDIPGNMVNDLNNQIALYSERFVISHNKALLRKTIDRTKLFEKEPYKVIINVEGNPLYSKPFKVTR